MKPTQISNNGEFIKYSMPRQNTTAAIREDYQSSFSDLGRCVGNILNAETSSQETMYGKSIYIRDIVQNACSDTVSQKWNYDCFLWLI